MYKYLALIFAIWCNFNTVHAAHKKEEMLINQWFKAIEEDDLCALQELSAHTDINVQEMSNGNTALIAAATFGHERIVQFLLTVPGININAQNNIGETALIAAISNGPCTHHALDSFLKQMYVDTSTCCCHENITELLLQLEDININIQDREGNTALICACKLGHRTMVQFLLEMPGIYLNIKNDTNQTALSIALSKSKKDIACLIIHKIDTLRTAHKWELFEAIKHNNLETIQELITLFDENILAVTDDAGNTPLHQACICNNIPIAIFILQQAAEPRELLGQINKNGQLPLELLNPTSPLFLLCLELAYLPKTDLLSRISKLAKSIANKISQKKFFKKFNSKSKNLESKCSCCSASGCTLRCGKCKSVYYCCVNCQKAHWQVHKNYCNKKN